jgi:coenzyme F420-reducing hydrogenase beta subunit
MSGFSLNSFDGKPSYLYFSNQEERINSASGGFVYDAMRAAIKDNGVICGCVWDDKMKAVHIVSDKKEDLQRMQSSKYVQSDLTGCYPEVRKALKTQRKVVFCGTPCQTAGLKHYLGKTDTENLITICLICHGVASPLAWKKWAAVIEKKYNGKLVNVNMRDKSYEGYSTSYSKYTLRSVLNESTRYVGMPTFLVHSARYVDSFSPHSWLTRPDLSP